VSEDRLPATGFYDAMPALGTTATCEFCRRAVTLMRAESGWHYWTGAGEPVDGQRHCLGGQPPVWDGNLKTLHKPARLAWRYTPDGQGRFA
jgi:hypothetical protein